MFSKLKQLAYQFKHKDIFSKISVLDDIKWLLTSALNSEEPVHILLVGKPGLGKTQFLEAIEREYGDSYPALGSEARGAGLVFADIRLMIRYYCLTYLRGRLQHQHYCHLLHYRY